MLLGFHGGGCCGVRHLFGFGHPNVNWKERLRDQGYPTQQALENAAAAQIRGQPIVASNAAYSLPVADTQAAEFEKMMEYLNTPSHGFSSKCIEVVFTDWQFNSYPAWPKLLKDAGFEFKTRFCNNGSSWCNVFHKVVDSKYEDKNPPKWWTALQEAESKPQAEAETKKAA
jgi:hypothetical protein